MKKNIPVINSTQVTKLKNLIYGNLLGDTKSVFEDSESYESFFDSYTSLKYTLGEDISRELFYAIKLGYLIPGAPHEILYLLKMAKDSFGPYPNYGIQSISKYTKNYPDTFIIDGEEFTINDLATTIYGMPFTAIDENHPINKLPESNLSEVFIDVNGKKAVAILPNDIVQDLDYSSIGRITYEKDKGLSLDGNLLRFMSGRHGIVKNEFNYSYII